MTDELFPTQETLSPRLKWMRKYNVTTAFNSGVERGDEDEFGNEITPWVAWSGKIENAIDERPIGKGDTEDEALVALAKANGWRLWNEL